MLNGPPSGACARRAVAAHSAITKPKARVKGYILTAKGKKVLITSRRVTIEQMASHPERWHPKGVERRNEGLKGRTKLPKHVLSTKTSLKNEGAGTTFLN